MCPAIVLSHLCLQSSYLPIILAYYGEYLVPVLLLRLLWAWFGSDPGICQSCGALNCTELSLCFLLRSFCWWAGPAVRSDVCPQPTAGAKVEHFVWLSFLLPGAGVILEWCWPISRLLVYFHACDATLDGFLLRSGWRGRFTGGHRGRVPVFATYDQFCCGRGPIAIVCGWAGSCSYQCI